jgi:hypothetical protein
MLFLFWVSFFFVLAHGFLSSDERGECGWTRRVMMGMATCPRHRDRHAPCIYLFVAASCHSERRLFIARPLARF